MTKRKAEDICSPARSKQACFKAPQWVLDGQHRTLHMISSPARVRTTSFEGDVNTNFQQQQTSPNRHRRNGSRHGQADINMDCGQTAWMEYLDARRTQELPDVSRGQFDQVVAQNEGLEAKVDSLSQELARAKSQITELEAQCLQQYVYQNCASLEMSHMPRPGFQQPMYFAPHQFVPAPRG